MSNSATKLKPAAGLPDEPVKKTGLGVLIEEHMLPAAKAGRLLGVNVATIIRWIERGSDGVILEAAKVGSRWMTSREALERFSEKLSSRRDSATAGPTPERGLGARAPRPASATSQEASLDRGLAAYGVR